MIRIDRCREIDRLVEPTGTDLAPVPRPVSRLILRYFISVGPANMQGILFHADVQVFWCSSWNQRVQDELIPRVVEIDHRAETSGCWRGSPTIDRFCEDTI